MRKALLDYEIERTHNRLARAEVATRPGQSVANSQGKPMLPAKLVGNTKSKKKPAKRKTKK